MIIAELTKPFTDKERTFAEENIKLMYALYRQALRMQRIKIVNGVDSDELFAFWCEAYLIAVHRYLQDSALRKQYSFATVVYNTGVMRVRSAVRSVVGCARRYNVSIWKTISIDEPINESGIMLKDVLVDEDAIDIENYVVSKVYSTDFMRYITQEMTASECILLCIMEQGWRQTECSAVLNCTKANVNNYIRNIRKKLSNIDIDNLNQKYLCTYTKFTEEKRHQILQLLCDVITNEETNNGIEAVLYKNAKTIRKVALLTQSTVFEVYKTAYLYMQNICKSST